jgi:hypothetical protein
MSILLRRLPGKMWARQHGCLKVWLSLNDKTHEHADRELSPFFHLLCFSTRPPVSSKQLLFLLKIGSTTDLTTNFSYVLQTVLFFRNHSRLGMIASGEKAVVRFRCIKSWYSGLVTFIIQLTLLYSSAQSSDLQFPRVFYSFLLLKAYYRLPDKSNTYSQPFTMYISSSVALIALASSAQAISFPNLFRRDACPAVWTQISQELTSLFLTDSQCNDDARGAIRAVFHDCFPGNGCDGSLATPEELARPINAPLVATVTKLQNLATQYNVTVADMIAFAGCKLLVSS